MLIGRVKRMDALIDGILHYSRVGRIEKHKQVLDLNEAVADVIDSLSLPAHIRVSIVNDLPSITADRTRITVESQPGQGATFCFTVPKTTGIAHKQGRRITIPFVKQRFKSLLMRNPCSSK